MIVTAALLLLSAAGSRVVLRRDGLLTVWSLPWPRRVRLAELDRIEVTPGDHDASNGRVARQTPVVLVDRPGSRVELIGESWQDPGLLMPTLAAWAVRTGTPVDATTRAYLLEGSPPAPRGLRPATP
jgi:hypothetical protein